MRKADRKYSIKRKKLVKTTTFVTLLVAATMILSGAVTGITMLMNEKTTTMESKNTGEIVTFDADDISSPEFTDQELGQTDEMHLYKHRGTIRGDIVWDNGMDYDNGNTAQTTLCIYDGEPADDFVFEETTMVGDLHWIMAWRYYWLDWPIIVTFYEDDGSGNFPGAVHAGPFTITEYTKQYIEYLWSAEVYAHSCELPATAFQANQKYWISIMADGACYPRTFWNMHSDPIIESFATFRSDYFTGGAWTITTYDMCFQLTTVPENDVGVTEIKHPTSGDTPGCPCIPVELEVSNLGQNAQNDVPVTVEIHENFFVDGFEDGGQHWEIFPYPPDCSWGIVPIETSFPFLTPPDVPYEGFLMAELQQSGCLGVSTLTTAVPVDLSGPCIDPWFKFYMWHDHYGSDDYLTVEVSADGFSWVEIGGPYYRLCCPECPRGWQEYRIHLDGTIVDGAATAFFRFVGHCEMPLSGYNLLIDYVSVFDMEYYASTTVDLDVGEIKQVEFDCWDATCWWCEYENDDLPFYVGAWTDMEGDEVPDNDGFGPNQDDFQLVMIHIPYVHDVGDKEILEPSQNYYMAQTIPMKQLIKNYGKEPEGCFNVYMSIEERYIVSGGPGIELVPLEEFEGAWPPAGWTRNIFPGYIDSWRPNTDGIRTNYAGGSGKCAASDSDWFGPGVGGELQTPSFSLMGINNAILEFTAAYNYLWGAEYFSVEVSISGPGGPWATELYWAEDHSPYGPGEPVQLSLAAYENQPSVIVRFVYEDTFSWDWWCQVDDVHIFTPFEPYVYDYHDPFYIEQVCIDDIGVCQEIEVPFPDWIPEPPEPCYCGTVTYRISSWTKMLDPPDQNAINNKKTKLVTVEFLHDVGIVEFTSPAVSATSVDFLGYHDGHTESAWKYTAGEDWSHAIQLTDAKLAPYRGDEITSVLHSCGDDVYGFCVADYEIWISDSLEDPTAPPVVYGTGTSSGTGWDTVALDMAYVIPAAGDVYLGITYSNYISDPTAFPAGVDEDNYVPEGYWFYYGATWQDAQPLLGPAVWGLSAGVTPGDGNGDEVPEPEVYISCGDGDVSVLIENFGTYDENPVTVTWKLYEYQPAKTEVDSGTYVTALDAGDTEDCLLTTYPFAPGVYEVEVEVQLTPPSMDCNLANNGPVTLVIGVDCCEPDCCFVLDPENPDGENNWYISDVTVTVDAWDTCEIQSGIAKIVYILDGVMNEILGAHGDFVITGDGVHHCNVYAVDNVGHEGVHHTFEVAIDTTDPTVELVYNKYTDAGGTEFVEFTALAADATSGMNRVEFTVDGVLKETIPGAGPYNYTVAWAGYDESTVVCAIGYDNAGNDDDECESGIKFGKDRSQSQSRSKTFSVSREVLRLGR